MTVFSIDIPGRPIPFTDTDVETLEAINRLLCAGHAGVAAIKLGEFLDHLQQRHFADLDRQS